MVLLGVTQVMVTFEVVLSKVITGWAQGPGARDFVATGVTKVPNTPTAWTVQLAVMTMGVPLAMEVPVLASGVVLPSVV